MMNHVFHNFFDKYIIDTQTSLARKVPLECPSKAVIDQCPSDPLPFKNKLVQGQGQTYQLLL